MEFNEWRESKASSLWWAWRSGDSGRYMDSLEEAFKAGQQSTTLKCKSCGDEVHEVICEDCM